MSDRLSLLNQWANSIFRAAGEGMLTGTRKPQPIKIYSIETVSGPRAGALEILAGLDAGRLLKILSGDDYAIHRQFVPWDFIGQPSVFMSGRYVRLEAGWPDGMAEKDIPLSDVGQYPKHGGRWIAGRNEHGQTITLGLSDTIPHYLFGGWTGSGKTWALRSALVQLAQDPDNELVLIDAKWGDGLGVLSGLPHLAGPVATDFETGRAALGWAVENMRHRYETGNKTGRVIVGIDEVQEMTIDPGTTDLIRLLAEKGRGANVHLLVGTQNPTAQAFSNSSIRRNLPGRVALKTENYDASKVVVGSNLPRSDRLLGAGDAYAVVSGQAHRAQLAYIPEHVLGQINGSQPEQDEWPRYEAEVGGTLGQESSNPQATSGKEFAVSLVQAHLGNGRPTLIRAFDNAGLGRPGSGRADRLLALGREAHGYLRENDWTLCEV